jgi:pimeloyl-ACP methyl ester carboxylesterase
MSRQLATRSYGASSGTHARVVVLPGFGVSRYLRAACEQLAIQSGLTVHLVDPPGFGMNREALPARVTVATAVDVLRPWLADLGPTLLVGQSTGCLLAARAADPDYELDIGALALVSPVFAPTTATVIDAARLLALDGVREPWWLGPSELPEWLRNLRGLPRYLRSCLAEQLDRRLDALRCPVLIVRGERDRLCPHDWATELANAAGRVLVTVPGGAHTYMAAEPTAFADSLAVGGFGTPWPGPR